MIDRTDLQMLLCEQSMEMDTHSLIELASEITGHDLEMSNEEEEIMAGSLVIHQDSRRGWDSCYTLSVSEFRTTTTTTTPKTNIQKRRIEDGNEVQK